AMIDRVHHHAHAQHVRGEDEFLPLLRAQLAGTGEPIDRRRPFGLGRLDVAHEAVQMLYQRLHDLSQARIGDVLPPLHRDIGQIVFGHVGHGWLLFLIACGIDIYVAISRRTISAPSTIARIFPNATSRGRYLRPQSGATTIRSAGANGNALRMRAATVSGASTVRSDRSITPRMIVFDGNCCKTERSSLGCAASIET